MLSASTCVAQNASIKGPKLQARTARVLQLARGGAHHVAAPGLLDSDCPKLGTLAVWSSAAGVLGLCPLSLFCSLLCCQLGLPGLLQGIAV